MKTQRLATCAAAGTMILAFALTGCSNAGEDESQSSESQDQTSETAPAQNEDDSDDEAGDDDGAQEPKSEGPTKTGSAGLPADADLSKKSPTVTPEDAVSTARKEVKDGTVHAIELDFDSSDTAWQYEVQIFKGNTDFDVEIDAESGEVVNVEKDDSDDEEKAVDLKDPLTYDEALKLAQEKASGRLEGWTLESDDNRIEYQFDFDDNGQDLDISVDVESKKVSVDD